MAEQGAYITNQNASQLHRKICNRAEMIRKQSGIYFLCKSGKVVYVGQSSNLVQRIGKHLAQGRKNFDSYHYIIIEHNLDNVEANYIVTLQPKYNKKLPKNSIYESISTIAKKTKWLSRDVKKKIKRDGLMPVYKDWYTRSDVLHLLEEGKK